MGMKPEVGGSVSIEQRVEAPPEEVAAFVGDFRNATAWMVGVEGVERLGEDRYRLTLDTPIGKVHPEIKMLEHTLQSIRWVYTSAVEGGGRVDVSPAAGGGCLVSYAGDFKLGRRFLDRAARFAGADRFARRNGERSLLRLKSVIEARRNR